jgi:hypothetical protein
LHSEKREGATKLASSQTAFEHPPKKKPGWPPTKKRGHVASSEIDGRRKKGKGKENPIGRSAQSIEEIVVGCMALWGVLCRIRQTRREKVRVRGVVLET